MPIPAHTKELIPTRSTCILVQNDRIDFFMNALIYRSLKLYTRLFLFCFQDEAGDEIKESSKRESGEGGQQ